MHNDDAPRKTVWRFHLNYRRPPKGLHANDRGHWSNRAKSTAMIREQVYEIVRALHVPALERIRIDLTWVVGVKRSRDAPNLWPFAKAIVDGIASNKGVSARIVDDDTDEYVEQAVHIEFIKGAVPHFVVAITDLGSAE